MLKYNKSGNGGKIVRRPRPWVLYNCNSFNYGDIFLHL